MIAAKKYWKLNNKDNKRVYSMNYVEKEKERVRDR